MSADPINLLINLSEGFYRMPSLEPAFARWGELGEVRRRSCNTADEILPDLQWADAVLMWSWPMLTAELLDQCPRLRFSANLDIAQPGAEILLERGIPVSLAKRGFSPAVAEVALTLILSALRRTPTYQAAMWAGTETWVKRFPDDIDPDERELTGMRVGLVGFGGTGRRLAELLAPFRCDVQVYDPYVSASEAGRSGVRSASLDEMAHSVEVLVVCAAANSGTRHIVEARHIEALPRGAVLVSISRAALIDGDALFARLKRGDMYAALDVYDQEPLPPESLWRSLPNVYLTPHRAGGIIASVKRLLDFLTDDLEAFFEGRERQHALTPQMLPSLDG